MKKFLPWVIVGTIIWFIITWLYISLNVFDVSSLAQWEYKMFTYRERFLELFLLIWTLAFGFCLGKTLCCHAAPVVVGDPDDLTKVEGIGPKISQALAASGITTFTQLSAQTPAKISEMIVDIRGKHIPDTWPKQAKMAANEKWDELAKYQDSLNGGV